MPPTDMACAARFEDSSFDFIFEKACIDSQFASTNTYNVVLQINQEVRTRREHNHVSGNLKLIASAIIDLSDSKTGPKFHVH